MLNPLSLVALCLEDGTDFLQGVDIYGLQRTLTADTESAKATISGISRAVGEMENTPLCKSTCNDVPESRQIRYSPPL